MSQTGRALTGIVNKLTLLTCSCGRLWSFALLTIFVISIVTVMSVLGVLVFVYLLQTRFAVTGIVITRIQLTRSGVKICFFSFTNMVACSQQFKGTVNALTYQCQIVSLFTCY